LNNKKHGFGEWSNKEGDSYMGHWSEGVPHQKGNITYNYF